MNIKVLKTDVDKGLIINIELGTSNLEDMKYLQQSLHTALLNINNIMYELENNDV